MRETIRLLLGGDPLLQTTLLLIGITSSAVTVILTLMRIFGGVDADHTSDSSGEVDTEHGISIGSFLSVHSLSMFFAMFGLVGFAALRSNFSSTLSLGIGFGAGVCAMVAIVMLMRAISSLGSSGTMKPSDIASAYGTTQTQIPGIGQPGIGLVALDINGMSHEYQATAGCEDPLPAGMHVKVVQTRGPNAVVVVPA